MVTDLPEPLSPTTPSSSPGAIEKLTPFTAWTAPSRVANTVLRSDTSRTGAGPSSIHELPVANGVIRRARLSGPGGPRTHSASLNSKISARDNRELRLDAATAGPQTEAVVEGSDNGPGGSPRARCWPGSSRSRPSRTGSNLDLIGFVEDYLAGLGVAAIRVPDATGEKAALVALVGPEVAGRRRALGPHRRGAGRRPGLDQRPLRADRARRPAVRPRRLRHEGLLRLRAGARARDAGGGPRAADHPRAQLRRGDRLPRRAADDRGDARGAARAPRR